QAFPNVAGSDQLAILARARTVVDGELHLNRRGVDGPKRQRGAIRAVRDGFANKRAFKTGNTNDVAGMGFGNFNPLHPLKVINRRDLADFLMPVPMDASARVADLNL